MTRSWLCSIRPSWTHARRLFALALACLLFVPTLTTAQTSAKSTDKLQWDQAAPDLQTAKTYRYQVYLDAAPAGLALNADCAGTSAPVCVAPLPPLTPGAHVASVTASLVLPDGTLVESPKSAPVTFTLIVVPQAPDKVRLVASIDDWLWLFNIVWST
jgi:hypothetical protein